MSKRKICLFTAHSPLTGGGGVILRSLIANLPEFEISWYYIAAKVAEGYEAGYLGEPIMGRAIIDDTLLTWKMLADKEVLQITNLVNELSKVECDQYWIVSHNEGLRIALELSRRQNLPVHMTVHDDWAGALSARSFRYRLMYSLAKRLTVKALKKVSSFDVISTGMAEYYKQLTGIKGQVCHRYLPAESITITEKTNAQDNDVVTAGHIGSIYDKADFLSFLTLFSSYVKAMGKKPILKMWGCHLTINDIPEKLKDNIFFYPTLPEEVVIPELAKCAFVYAMYPLNKSLRVFSQTSLPTKLTSYLQAGRPIFGHGPASSTLATFVNSNKLGVMWHSGKSNEGISAFKKLLAIKLDANTFETTRQHYFGEENLRIMKRFFG